MSKWPRDNQRELIRFYGNPGDKGPGGVAAQLVSVVPPFKMYYDTQRVKALRFHRKAAPALLAALNEIWAHVGKDQAKLDELGVSKTAGTFNPRKVRGSATKWSNHAFGAAIDFNAEENGMYSEGNIPAFVVAAFERQGFRWGGRYKGRKDPMHFEACDNGRGALAALSGAIVGSANAYEGDKEFETSSDNGIELDDGSVTSGVTSAIKPLLKSKIGWVQSILAFFGIGTVGSQVDASFLDKAWAFVTSPGFLLLVIIACVGLTIYWRWADHGRGQK